MCRLAFWKTEEQLWRVHCNPKNENSINYDWKWDPWHNYFAEAIISIKKKFCLYPYEVTGCKRQIYGICSLLLSYKVIRSKNLILKFMTHGINNIYILNYLHEKQVEYMKQHIPIKSITCNLTFQTLSIILIVSSWSTYMYIYMFSNNTECRNLHVALWIEKL